MSDLAATLHKLFASGQFSEVLRAADSASVRSTTDPISSKVVAAAHFQLGEFKESASLLAELESSFCSDPDFLSMYAATCRRLGDLTRAEDLFAKALELSPESSSILNNYANLLIDVKRFDEAEKILVSLTNKYPDYQDAIKNLNRLSQLREQDAVSDSLSKPAEKLRTQSNLDLDDPLLLAFDEDEINYSIERYFPSLKKSSSQSVPSLPVIPDDRLVALDQLKYAEAAMLSGDSITVLKLCSKALLKLGQEARIYELASDAYLNLQKVSQAELCLLQAVALGGKTPKRCINLASFAMLRGNLDLANDYVVSAASIDPSFEHLNQVKSLLAAKRAEKNTDFVFTQVWDEPDLQKK